MTEEEHATFKSSLEMTFTRVTKRKHWLRAEYWARILKNELSFQFSQQVSEHRWASKEG